MTELLIGVLGMAFFGFVLYKAVKAVAIMIREAEGVDRDEK